MKRREFIVLLGGAAMTWPLAARAQQPTKSYRIGMLETISAALNAPHLDAFRKGLRELGYVEGKNYTIEYRSADGRAERFPELAAELVRLGVDLIVVRGTPGTIAAKNATGTIPVVMASVGDPLLIVDSLAHPGGNVTGLSAFVNEMTSKRIGLMKELVPAMSRIALFANMSNAVAPPQWEETTGVIKRGPEACPIRRVPAAEVEAAIIDQVRALVRTPEIIVRTWKEAHRHDGSITEDEIRKALSEFDIIWEELFPAEQARLIQLLIQRVDIRLDGLTIRLRTDGLASLAADLQQRAAA